MDPEVVVNTPAPAPEPVAEAPDSATEFADAFAEATAEPSPDTTELETEVVAAADTPAAVPDAPAGEPSATPAAETKPAAEPAPAAPTLTAEEQAKIDAYKDDWPDIAEAEALIKKQQAADIKDEVFSAVGMVFKEFYALVAPLLTAHNKTAAASRDTDINAKVADYQQIKDAVRTWVDTQPSLVAKAYKETLDTGSADDVFKVVSTYKQAVGMTTPQTTPPTEPQRAPAPALELVQTGRRTTPVTSEVSKDDFSGGWADALRNVKL